MGVVDQTIEHCIGDGGGADEGVPSLDREM